MRYRQVTWSPVEVEYLKAHEEEPMSQLCIALAKTKYAIKKKQAELHSGGGKVKLKKQGLRSRIGKRPDLNNMFFRSSWEANVYRLLIMDPELKLVEYEPTDFTFWQFGIKKGTVSYTPDFKITYHDGSYKWIEVKGGFMKGTDKTKLRRFKKFYPDDFAKLVAVTPGLTSKTAVFFTEMGIPIRWIYNELNKAHKKTVKNWE